MSTDPLVKTGRALSKAETTRYARHVLLPDVGRDGQERLAAARVLVVGAGGLGSPALLYLAAAGVGTIGVVDADVFRMTGCEGVDSRPRGTWWSTAVLSTVRFPHLRDPA